MNTQTKLLLTAMGIVVWILSFQAVRAQNIEDSQDIINEDSQGIINNENSEFDALNDDGITNNDNNWEEGSH